MTARIEVVTYFNHSLFTDFQCLKILNKSKEIRLWENTSFVEINSMIAKFFKQTKVTFSPTLYELLDTISKVKLDDFARLKFTNDKAEMYSGCCFNFVDWVSLTQISRQNYSIWLGHDPTTFIDYSINKDKLIIWKDEKYVIKKEVNEKNFIEISFKEFKSCLVQLKNDLENFSILLDVWAEQFEPKNSKKAISQIQISLGIFNSS
jgi:hypothetical protein